MHSALSFGRMDLPLQEQMLGFADLDAEQALDGLGSVTMLLRSLGISLIMVYMLGEG